VDGHVEEEAAAVRRKLVARPLDVAARREYEQRLSDRPRVEKPPGLEVGPVEPPLVADLDDEVGTPSGRLGKAAMACERGRSRLLEQEVLPRVERRGAEVRVVDRAGSDDERVDILRRQQLFVGAAPTSWPSFAATSFARAGRVEATATRRAPAVVSALCAWTTPIAPRPTTPTRTGGAPASLDKADSSMAASEIACAIDWRRIRSAADDAARPSLTSLPRQESRPRPRHVRSTAAASFRPRRGLQ
jgi:hypothetical protein